MRDVAPAFGIANAVNKHGQNYGSQRPRHHCSPM